MATTVARHRDMGFDGAPLTQSGTIRPGAVVHRRTYNYPTAPDPSLTDVPAYTEVSETWEDMDTAAAVTRYAVQPEASPRVIEAFLPDGTRTRTELHNEAGRFDDGLPYRQEIWDGNTLVHATETAWELGDYASPRVARIETIFGQGRTTAAEYDYGPYNRLTELREFEFGGTDIARRTRTSYVSTPSYVARHILRLPSVVEVFDRFETMPSARTEYFYDSQPLRDTPGVVQHLQSHNPYALRTWLPPYDELECDDEPEPRASPVPHHSSSRRVGNRVRREDPIPRQLDRDPPLRRPGRTARPRHRATVLRHHGQSRPLLVPPVRPSHLLVHRGHRVRLPRGNHDRPSRRCDEADRLGHLRPWGPALSSRPPTRTAAQPRRVTILGGCARRW